MFGTENMKKILIAGYEKNISNYQQALKHLGIYGDSINSMSFSTTNVISHDACTCQDDLITACIGYDGLVLPGGDDISPKLLDTPNAGSRNIDETLDRIQLALLKTFIMSGKPILGICKGLQLINVFFGGTLIQDLPEESRRIHEASSCEHIPATKVSRDRIHITKAARGTFPELLYGPHPVTNSAHHQAIGTVGDGLLVAQYSIDFVIEAMYHSQLPILGVQWHPERMCFDYASPDMEDGSLLLRYFHTLL